VGTGSRKVVWAPSAHADLDDVLARRLDAADLLEEILNAAASLSTLSERGRLVPEIDNEVTREIFVHDFRLMYEVTRDHVHVVALMYGARDFENWRRDRERR
jgi:plasmid stabilization system protein ParE